MSYGNKKAKLNPSPACRPEWRNCPSFSPTRLADGLGLEVSYADQQQLFRDAPQVPLKAERWFPRVACLFIRQEASAFGRQHIKTNLTILL